MYLNDYGNPKHLKLVVIREASQHKLIVFLVKEVANEEDFGAGTLDLEIKYYHLNQNGVSVQYGTHQALVWVV